MGERFVNAKSGNHERKPINVMIGIAELGGVWFNLAVLDCAWLSVKIEV